MKQIEKAILNNSKRLQEDKVSLSVVNRAFEILNEQTYQKIGDLARDHGLLNLFVKEICYLQGKVKGIDIKYNYWNTPYVIDAVEATCEQREGPMSPRKKFYNDLATLLKELQYFQILQEYYQDGHPKAKVQICNRHFDLGIGAKCTSSLDVGAHSIIGLKQYFYAKIFKNDTTFFTINTDFPGSNNRNVINLGYGQEASEAFIADPDLYLRNIYVSKEILPARVLQLLKSENNGAMINGATISVRKH